MENLILGKSICAEFFRLNNDLRFAVQKVAINFGCDSNVYTPWMCTLPIHGDILSKQLHDLPSCLRGHMVTDVDYLIAVSKHVRYEIEKLQENSYAYSQMQVSMKGTPDSWAPLSVVDRRVIELFHDGYDYVINSGDSIAKLYDELIDFVVPIQACDKENRGFSSITSRGVIFRSFPSWATAWDVAFDVIHELGHQSLFVWQSIDKIISSDPNAPVFSLIRKGYRPAMQTFHGAIALAFMVYLQRAYSDNVDCQNVAMERGRWYAGTLNDSLGLALESLKADCQFTDIGKYIYNEMDCLVI